MKEILVRGRTLTEAYHKSLVKLAKQGTIVSCPAYNTVCREVAMTMTVERPLVEPRISRFFPGSPYDLEKYVQEILNGIMDFCVGKGWDYTYHLRMTRFPCRDENGDDWEENQIDFVIDELSSDPYSRRAIIIVRDVYADSYMGDPACLQHIQFLIRKGRLDCEVLFRSNDALEAAFMNAFALISLQEDIAKKLGVRVGTYTHRANSYHVYEKDWPMLDNAVQRIRTEAPEKLTFRLEGEWDEMMAEARPEIVKFVEGLKNG